MTDDFHTPVLLQEAIDALAVKPRKKYIDATLGGGRHAFEILKRGGEVLGIDADEEAIEYIKKILRDQDIRILGETEDKALNISISQYPNIILVRGNFRDIEAIAKRVGFGKVVGVLFDLGVSLHQLKTAERGFSFQKEGPLDMRMDPSTGSGQAGATAADLVNGLYEHELAYLFEKYGEERMARSIARAICLAREIKRIETTKELVDIVERSALRRGRHPATQVFQALRIAVNDELNNLEKALPEAASLLEKDGRIVVISFHSLEDRLVKNFFKGHEVTDKPVQPKKEEVMRNPRARSAKLRIYQL